MMDSAGQADSVVQGDCLMAAGIVVDELRYLYDCTLYEEYLEV